MKKLALAAACAILLSACASSGRPISQDQIDQIVRGKTTQADLIASLGSPMSQSYNSDGTRVLTWAYAYVGFAGIGTETQGLSVIIGPDGKVTGYTTTGSSIPSARLGK